MFVVIQGIIKTIGRLEFLSQGLLVCILTRYFLISLRNADQRTRSKSGHFASVYCCSSPGNLGGMSEYGLSIIYQYYLCREKQINLHLQKYLTTVHMYYISERFVTHVDILLCFAKFKRVIF